MAELTSVQTISGCMKLCIWLALFHTVHSVGDESKKLPRIGIIGGGIGGTASAHFLRQLFGPDISVDLYEPNQIGGRIASIKVGDHLYEAGATIIHPLNMHMVKFAKLLGLKKRDQASSKLGLYDGKKMVFTGSRWSYITMAKLFWRYGWDMFRIKSYIDQMLANFTRIYTHQEAGHAFTTVEQLLESMSPDFPPLLHRSTMDHFTQEGFSRRFTDELVMAGLRSNYGQTNDIQAFVGAVSMAGVQPGLWAVNGGNTQVPEGLLQRSKAKLFKSKVTRVELNAESKKIKYRVHSEGGLDDNNNVKSDSTVKEYDVLIVATPLDNNMADISFQNIPTFPKLPKFHRTVATFVQGLPNVTRFGFDDMEDYTDTMLTVNPDVFFNSFARNCPVDYKRDTPSDDKAHPVWKVFSQVPLTDKQFDELFAQRSDVNAMDWLAYPHYPASMGTIPPFVLHDQLYYVNTIELAASAMEMVAIGAKNVALLAFNQWNGQKDKVNSVAMYHNQKQEL